MGFVALFLIVVAALRVTDRHQPKRARLFTLALLSLGAGYLCADTRVGDDHIDPFCAAIGLGQNASELLHGVFLAVACWLLGLMWLLPLAQRPRLRSRYSSRYRWILYRRDWTAFSLTVATVSVVAHRMSGAPSRPVGNMLELRSPWGAAYIVAVMVHVIVSALIVLAGSSVVARRSGQRGTVLSMVAFVVLGLAVLAYIAGLVNWLVMAPDPHRADVVRQSVAGVVLVMLGLLGLAGPWESWWQSRRGRAIENRSAASDSGPDLSGPSSVDLRWIRVLGWLG